MTMFFDGIFIFDLVKCCRLNLYVINVFVVLVDIASVLLQYYVSLGYFVVIFI